LNLKKEYDIITRYHTGFSYEYEYEHTV